MTWGLALSGGAAYGLANAGVIEVLEREGFKPACISGSSMGAIIGALYALRGSSADFDSVLERLSMASVARLSDAPLKGKLLHGGIFRQQLEEHLSDTLGDACIGDCLIPFICVAGRVKEPVEWTRIIRPGFTEYIVERIEPVFFPPKTRLLDAIMASSAIPVAFSPIVIGEYEYIDLVHFGAIPARTLREVHGPDVVIATNTAPVYDSLIQYLPRSWSDFLQRGYDELEKSKAACDVIITPHLTSGPFRFDKAREFMKAGEEAAREELPNIRALLNRTES